MAQAKHKKRFFKVDMPILGKETELQAFELSELEGRIIKYDWIRCVCIVEIYFNVMQS